MGLRTHLIFYIGGIFTDMTTTVESNVKEDLILFLGRSYFSQLNEKEISICVKYLLEFFPAKSILMGNILPIFSTNYNLYLSSYEKVVQKNKFYTIYISKSKSEIQYLDSLFS